MKRQEDLVKWAKDREIFKKSDPLRQISKTQEELTETRDAVIRWEAEIALTSGVPDPVEIKDGIGDQVVTLVLLAHMHGWTLEECVEHAWDEIKDRTGEMKDGVFVKD